MVSFEVKLRYYDVKRPVVLLDNAPIFKLIIIAAHNQHTTPPTCHIQNYNILLSHKHNIKYSNVIIFYINLNDETCSLIRKVVS